ncbi:hypothetical protein ACN6KF_003043 [Labrys sp. La1]|uniref:hypothetical protein n=1 Tax=Labrys sp. La1 TaxID=3404917 RepID=UPI003EBFC4D3
MSRISIKPATLRDMTWIAVHMREQDRREIRAVIDESDTAIGAMLYGSSQGLAWCAWINDTPVCAFGVTRLFHGLGSAWAYGSKSMVRTIPAVTRFAMRTMKPMLVAEGFRRIEVRTAIDHDISHRWLERLGFTLEGTARDYGAGGLDFLTYAATRQRKT